MNEFTYTVTASGIPHPPVWLYALFGVAALFFLILSAFVVRFIFGVFKEIQAGRERMDQMRKRHEAHWTDCGPWRRGDR